VHDLLPLDLLLRDLDLVEAALLGDLLDLELAAEELVAQRLRAHGLGGGFELGAVLGNCQVLELCHFRLPA
jgi:hypothetical protein